MSTEFDGFTPEQQAALARYEEKLKTAIFVGMSVEDAARIFKNTNDFRASGKSNPELAKKYDESEKNLLSLL